MVEAHPELNVHFTTKGDTIVQTLADSVPVEVPVTEMSDEALTSYKNEFVRPFNLQKAPLYRFEVVKTESGVHLLTDVHHLIFDGGSADLFIRQINSVLDGSAVEKESYTYLDFVNDQQKAEESETFKAAQRFLPRSCRPARVPARFLPTFPRVISRALSVRQSAPYRLRRSTPNSQLLIPNFQLLLHRRIFSWLPYHTLSHAIRITVKSISVRSAADDPT